MDDKTLAHIGILGMHWGHRQSSPTSGSKNAHQKFQEELRNLKSSGKASDANIIAAAKRYDENRAAEKAAKAKPKPIDTTSDDHQQATILKNKKVSEMSNAEIKKLAERLQLEKQYADITESQKGVGEKAIREVLMNSAKQAVTPILVERGKSILNWAIDKGLKAYKDKKAKDYADILLGATI